MSKLLNIGVVTGSRADYGLLYCVLKAIKAAPELRLQVFVTGMHLAPEYGDTWKVIEADGFEIDQKIHSLLASDCPVSVSKSVGLGVIGFADAFAQTKPDLVVLLGDRFEILAAAQACLIARIPVAHIAGGDTTEGAFDESIRHAITKMAHLHFVTNDESATRVRQMGEDPARIYNVGSPGIDYIQQCTLLKRAELEEALGCRLARQNLLVTFHPVTLARRSQTEQMDELLAALAQLDDTIGIFFTLPNADTEGRKLAEQVKTFVGTRSGSRAFTSLGQQKYLSFIAQVDAVVGNSSSGLYEAPTLKVPTVNIGDRQKGRLQAPSIINCEAQREAISAAINKALDFDASHTVNPYGDGHSAQRIVNILRSLQDPTSLLQKHFFRFDRV